MLLKLPPPSPHLVNLLNFLIFLIYQPHNICTHTPACHWYEEALCVPKSPSPDSLSLSLARSLLSLPTASQFFPSTRSFRSGLKQMCLKQPRTSPHSLRLTHTDSLAVSQSLQGCSQGSLHMLFPLPGTCFSLTEVSFRQSSLATPSKAVLPSTSVSVPLPNSLHPQQELQIISFLNYPLYWIVTALRAGTPSTLLTTINLDRYLAQGRHSVLVDLIHKLKWQKL